MIAKDAIAIGCMRLSTAPDRDDARSAALLVAAIDAGVTAFDTADAYALGPDDVGHNERLIAAARAARPDAAIAVSTKGGLVRHDGHWHPDGRAIHLDAAAGDSRDRLGTIDLYLLHAIDPRTPLATSVRALARLHEDGVARAIGICNVSRTQLEQALAIAPITAVQVELSPWKLDALRGGTLALAAERGLTVLAHRPLGGPGGRARLARDPVLAAVAAQHEVSSAAIALAWLRTRGAVPLPGPTSIEHVRDAVVAARLQLAEEDRAALDAHFLGALAGSPVVATPTATPAPAAPSDATAPAAGPAAPRDGEVVLVLGMPGSGKSTLAADYVARGYLRLNRDDRGGSLDRLAAALDEALAAGATRVVLDNTYPGRASRAPVIAAARRHHLPVRCVVADTSLEDAQHNAVLRLLDRHGALLDRPALARAARKDPGAIGPSVQFAWRRAYEPPTTDEGFTSIESRPFVRAPSPHTRRALLVDLDDLVWRDRPDGPAAIELLPGIADTLTAWAAAGFVVLGTAWRPPPLDATTDATLAALRAALPVLADVVTCPHPAGPPVCWCRKPLPGLGLLLARTHTLDLARSFHLGRSAADRGFASRLGVTFLDAGAPAPPPR